MDNIENPLIRSYRELLRVGRDPTPEELKRAYRAMALVYHPDQNPAPEAAAVFVRIKAAYETLRDPASVSRLNRNYLAGEGAQRCVEGLDIHTGTFFGHRFSRGRRRRSADPEAFPWWEPNPPLCIDERGNTWYGAGEESSASILDDPSLDLVEAIFAGQFVMRDEEALFAAFRKRDFRSLPWFVLNNEGVTHFLNHDYEAALACYEALNERIRDNIVFLFRLGVCHELVAFERKRSVLLMGARPDGAHVKAAIRCYERAIAVAESRPHLPQKCMTIRKTLADLLSSSGRRRRARQVWSRIQALDPESEEARERLAQDRPPVAGLLGSGGGA